MSIICSCIICKMWMYFWKVKVLFINFVLFFAYCFYMIYDFALKLLLLIYVFHFHWTFLSYKYFTLLMTTSITWMWSCWFLLDVVKFWCCQIMVVSWFSSGRLTTDYWLTWTLTFRLCRLRWGSGRETRRSPCNLRINRVIAIRKATSST